MPHTLPTALVDFADPHSSTAARLRYAFGVARQHLVAHQPDQVCSVLQAVQAAAAQGAWCVGHVRYEAASAFDPALQTHAADGPLAWFAVYDAPMPWPDDLALPPVHLHWQDTCTRPTFDAALARIHSAIAAGDCYQVNYTAPLHGRWQGAAPDGAAHALFAALQRAQPGGYAAMLHAGDEQVLSVSPELFFDWHDMPDGGSILARPMKGTAPRGDTPEQDQALAQALRTSPKERAENVMIVDLLRNDISRIAQPHSVQVPALFHTQALPAVWQMTSDVQARTRPGTTLADVFAALFPCGSVTGAPKAQAMRMIAELEPAPRGVYCGALGVVYPAPGGGVRATFNVPIRTVVLHPARADGVVAQCGIGSGITMDASPQAEWAEWRHKRAFVERASQPFDLLETLALDAGHYRHLPDHLARLQTAAAHFAYPCVLANVEQCLQTLASQHPTGLWRVRLLLNAQGQAHAQAFALQATPTPVRLQLVNSPFAQAHSEFTRYKTTHRSHYDAATPTNADVFDALLYNEQGQITECTRGNIAALLDGRWVTPPLHCGLLPGVGRAAALREGRLQEAVLTLADVPRVQGWAFVNSLRGWLPAQLV